MPLAKRHAVISKFWQSVPQPCDADPRLRVIQTLFRVKSSRVLFDAAYLRTNTTASPKPPPRIRQRRSSRLTYSASASPPCWVRSSPTIQEEEPMRKANRGCRQCPGESPRYVHGPCGSAPQWLDFSMLLSSPTVAGIWCLEWMVF